jgi:hypothetical protein
MGGADELAWPSSSGCSEPPVRALRLGGVVGQHRRCVQRRERLERGWIELRQRRSLGRWRRCAGWLDPCGWQSRLCVFRFPRHDARGRRECRVGLPHGCRLLGPDVLPGTTRPSVRGRVLSFARVHGGQPMRGRDLPRRVPAACVLGLGASLLRFALHDRRRVSSAGPLQRRALHATALLELPALPELRRRRGRGRLPGQELSIRHAVPAGLLREGLVRGRARYLHPRVWLRDDTSPSGQHGGGRHVPRLRQRRIDGC